MVSAPANFGEKYINLPLDDTPKLAFKLEPGTPPSDWLLEEQILNCLLSNPNGIEIVIDILVPKAFYWSAHEEIYRACLDVYANGRPVDLMSVEARLREKNQLDRVGGRSKLVSLVNQYFSSAHLDYQAKDLMDIYTRRLLLHLSREIADNVRAPVRVNKLLEDIEMEVKKVTHSTARYHSREEAHKQRINRVIQELRSIELNTESSVLKYDLRLQLAEKYNYTEKQLNHLYYKSIVDAMYEPFMSLSEAKEKYGAELTKWLMHGIAPKGQTILMPAPGGTGKTLIAHDLMFRLMTGTDLDEFSVAKKARKCLYIQVDTPANVALVSMAERGIEEGMPIRINTRWSTEHIAHLRKEIVDFGAEFVVIDSLTAASKFSLVSENEVLFARPILELNTIAQELGVTILILHHTNKSGGPRGSTAIYNAVSMVLEIKRDPGDSNPRSTRRLISITKARSRCPETYVWEMNTEDKSWQCLGKQQKEDTMPNTMRDTLIEFFKSHPNTPFEARELNQRLGGSYNHVRSTLYELADEGLVSKRREFKNKPYKFFVDLEEDEDQQRSAEISGVDQPSKLYVVSDKDLADPLILQKHDFGDAEEAEKTPKTKISGSANEESPATQEFSADPSGRSPIDLGRSQISQTNFFESQTAKTINAQPATHVGSITNNNSSEPLVTPTYSKGDRVTYTGDQPIHKGKIYEIVRPAPETWCDYSYICQDVAKPKATTVRLREKDLKLVEKNSEQH